MATKPKPYNFMLHREVRRWFREMEGYLETEKFIEQGTDKEGREYAFDGFLKLKKIILENPDILGRIVLTDIDE